MNEPDLAYVEGLTGKMTRTGLNTAGIEPLLAGRDVRPMPSQSTCDLLHNQ